MPEQNDISFVNLCTEYGPAHMDVQVGPHAPPRTACSVVIEVRMQNTWTWDKMIEQGGGGRAGCGYYDKHERIIVEFTREDADLGFIVSFHYLPKTIIL